VNTTLELLDHAPESFVLSDEQCAAMDETCLFNAAMTESMRDFINLGFGETAAGELAEIHVGAAA
jgi:hypothetical protein